MELNYLRVFYEVARAGRFTDAANRLHISQSALSRSVALLEESEGVQLLERSRRGVTLTPVGEEVFRHCERLFQTVQTIEEVCRGVKQACEGPLHFATPDHITNDLLVEPMRTFREEFPLVTPSIFIGTPEEITGRILHEECEFGLMFAKVNSPQIEYEALREEQMTLVVNAELWRVYKGVNATQTLAKIIANVGYISSIGAMTQSRPTRVLIELFGKMPRIGFEVNSQEAQKRICLARGGIAYLARFMVEREIMSGLLYEINVEHPHVFKLWLAHRKGHVMSPQARVFLERLRATWVR